MPTTQKATARITLTYTDAHAAAQAPPSLAILAPYEGQSHDGIDVPATTAADTEYSVSFGSVAKATGMLIENRTGNAVKAAINPAPSATGTLASGTVDILLDNAVGDLLVVKMVTSAGTAGVLSVKRKSATEVTVQSWLSGTGIQTADTSLVKVMNYGDGYPFQLPVGGVLALFSTAAAAALAPCATAVKLKTTATQSAAASIATDIFGDPV